MPSLLYGEEGGMALEALVGRLTGSSVQVEPDVRTAQCEISPSGRVHPLGRQPGDVPDDLPC